MDLRGTWRDHKRLNVSIRRAAIPNPGHRTQRLQKTYPKRRYSNSRSPAVINVKVQPAGLTEFAPRSYNPPVATVRFVMKK